ncbi:hypothetical protein D3C74_376460 [compost metagenome]
MRCKFLARILADPDIQRSPPIAVAADVPIHQFLQEFAETAFPHMIRIPIHTVVVRNELVLDCRCLDKPAVCCIVEQRGIAAPAERIAVLVFLFAVQQAFLG